MLVCGQKLLAMYEAATEAQPANTDLLRGLFVALVRVDNFTKQQQVCALHEALPPHLDLRTSRLGLFQRFNPFSAVR